MLNGRAAERVADPRRESLARVAIVVRDADFDELVRGQRDVDLMQHRVGESLAADGDHWVQVMRFRPELAAFRRGQRSHRDSVT